eukprot:529997_1
MFGSTSVHASLLRLGASFGINITKETEVISANVNNWYGLDQLDGIGYDDVLNISYTLYFMDNSHQKQILCHRENMTMIVGDDDRFSDTFHSILMQMRQGEKSTFKVSVEFISENVYVGPYPLNNNSRQAPQGKDTFYDIHVHHITKPKRVEPTNYSERLQVALKYKNDGNILFRASRISGAVKKYMHSIEWADIDVPITPDEKCNACKGTGLITTTQTMGPMTLTTTNAKCTDCQIRSEFSDLLIERHTLISACNNNLSLIYLQCKRWDLAIHHAEKVLEMDANNKKAIFRKNQAMENKEHMLNGFKNYKWEEDKVWCAFLDTLEYPAQFGEEGKKEHLFKKKKKYYKENIDCDFDDDMAYETIYNVNKNSNNDQQFEQKENERHIEAQQLQNMKTAKEKETTEAQDDHTTMQQARECIANKQQTIDELQEQNQTLLNTIRDLTTQLNTITQEKASLTQQNKEMVLQNDALVAKYSDVTRKYNEYIEENKQENDEDMDVLQDGPTQQFYAFLENIRLTEYFDQFKEASVCDIRDVEFFDADTLSDIKFRNKLHEKKLLKEAENFKVKMNEFMQLLKENQISSQHKLLFNKLGIVTVDILCNQIKEKKHLQQKCNITNVPQQDMIWRMIERQWNPNQYGEDRKDNQVDHNPDQGDEGAKAETAYI